MKNRSSLLRSRRKGKATRRDGHTGTKDRKRGSSKTSKPNPNPNSDPGSKKLFKM